MSEDRFLMQGTLCSLVVLKNKQKRTFLKAEAGTTSLGKWFQIGLISQGHPSFTILLKRSDRRNTDEGSKENNGLVMALSLFINDPPLSILFNYLINILN